MKKFFYAFLAVSLWSCSENTNVSPGLHLPDKELETRSTTEEKLFLATKSFLDEVLPSMRTLSPSALAAIDTELEFNAFILSHSLNATLIEYELRVMKSTIEELALTQSDAYIANILVDVADDFFEDELGDEPVNLGFPCTDQYMADMFYAGVGLVGCLALAPEAFLVCGGLYVAAEAYAEWSFYNCLGQNYP